MRAAAGNRREVDAGESRHAPRERVAFISPSGRAGAASASDGGAAGADGTAAVSSPGSSPSSTSTAITALTATPSLPSGTTMRPTMPSSTASTSIVALSVSISAITSPGSTLSPWATSHLTRLPSVMVGDKAGIRISVAIPNVPSGVADGPRRRGNARRVRQGQRFEIGG